MWKTDVLKTASKNAKQKATEATAALVGNTMAEKISKAASKSTLKISKKFYKINRDS